MSEEKQIYVCEVCGSDKIQQVMWTYVNTEEVVDMYGSGDIEDKWCDICQEHTEHVTKEEYDNDK